MSEICPHKCTVCGFPAYIGVLDHKCCSVHCEHYDLETAEQYAKEYMASQGGIPVPEQEVDEDADTEPRGQLRFKGWTHIFKTWPEQKS